MLLGFGWCHLLSSREALRGAGPEEEDDIDAAIDAADLELFRDFRQWMSEQGDSLLQWTLLEQYNNEVGLLTYSVSRNKRVSAVWQMLEWIRDHAPGSYGLFYCHDDEDLREGDEPPVAFHEVFRVHRLKDGKLEELPDPFFGVIDPNLGPLDYPGS